MTPKCYSYIRFSTPEQLRGDSLRRQLEMSEKYAKDCGLELDSLSLRDLGISAFNGQHRTKGALGQFLELVDGGKIKKGSILIVESLDRLSREQVLDALTQFTNIIRSGIKVVTLSDGMEYTKKSINSNIGQLIVSLTIMSRAHEESQMKSKRLKEVWINKRNNVSKMKLTARCPLWLELSEDKIKFNPVQERCKVINVIFEMKLAGKGALATERELNQSNVWKPKNGWRKSYINKILRNRAVLGEYQPHEKKNGKRVPIGDPIPDYYPAIVSEKLFYQVQDLIKRNRHYGGRNGMVSNLFGHIAKCAYCGSPMQYLNKGHPPKGNQYLICDKACRGLGCDKHYMRYKEVEELILTYCKGLRPEDILPDKKRLSELSQLENTRTVVSGKIVDIDSKINNIMNSIADTEDKRIRILLESKLSTFLDDKDSLEKKNAEIEKQIEKRNYCAEDVQSKLESTRDLFEYMQSKQGKELLEIRLKLRDLLRKLIDKILIYPVGRKGKTENGVKELEEFRTYKILFTGGNYRVLQPASEHVLARDWNEDEGISQYWYKNSKGKYIFKERKLINID